MRIIQKAYTFDDVLLVPAHSTMLPRDVTLKTRLTRAIQLNIPLVAAAMDTVTESQSHCASTHLMKRSMARLSCSKAC